MDDLLPVAELDPPTRPAADRAVPFLWVVVGLLLISSVVAAVVADRGATPAERIAAASDVATQEDYAFEATFGGLGSNGAATFRGAVDVDTGRMRGVIEAQGQTAETVQDGLVQYLHLPAGAFPGVQKPWLRIDLTAMGVDAADRSGTGPATNPIDALRRLDAIVGDVEEVGHEEVRGTDTTHFRFLVDGTKAQPKVVESLTDDQRARLRRTPVELWLDAQDRPRRLRQKVDLGPSAGGSLTTDIETFDFGKEVTVDLPPADQVQEFDFRNPSALLGGAGGDAD